MNKKILPILGIIIIIVLTGIIIGILFLQKEAEKRTFDEKVTTEEDKKKEELIEIRDWETYKNEKYGYKINYPEDYRIAEFIMKKRAEKDPGIKEQYKEEYSIEDLVIITNLSIEEEQEYLKECQDYYGGCYNTANFPAGIIAIEPFYSDRDIEKEVMKYESLSEEERYYREVELSNFRMGKTKQGVGVKRWNLTTRDEDYEVASISLLEKVLYPPLYYGDTDYQYLDEIMIKMIKGDDYEKNVAIFDKIISTIEFTEKVKEEVEVPENKLENKCETIQHITDSSEKSERDICYEDLAKKTNDESWCEKISEDSMLNNCYELLAKQKQDETICEKIKGEMERNFCYRDMAWAKDDETICENISTGENVRKWIKTFCYIKIAKERNNDSVCQELFDKKERDICYERFARDKGNKDSCAKITDLETRDNCYILFAFTQRDSSICEKIENSSRRTDCQERFVFDTSGWKTYSNSEYGFQFEVPPLFLETGYKIIEKEEKTECYWLKEDCGVIVFKLPPIEPYWGTNFKNQYNRMLSLYICPKTACQTEEGKQYCEALKKGSRELESGEQVWLFSRFVAENENFIVYKKNGPSSGDFADAAGWDKEEIQKIKHQMISTFRFVK